MEAAAIVGLVTAGIGLSLNLIHSMDVLIGACTHNTALSAAWSSALSDLKIELIHANDQLVFIKLDIEPMRVKQGPGPDAANLTRKEIKFDELLLELKEQLTNSESQIHNATDEFNQKRSYDWLLYEALTTQARKAIAPIQSQSEELKKTRLRVHHAREAIIMSYMTHCYNHGGDLFPTVESLGGIRDRLAPNFLVPRPFCGELGADDTLTSGLLRCNSSDDTLKKLYDRIHAKGSRWVREARQPAETSESRSPIATLDVLEQCQNTMLRQLDQGIFDPVIKGVPLFTTNDRRIAVDGRVILKTWLSIWMGGGSGIMIALGGKMSAGKSSILNAMLGRPLLPTAQTICTAVPCRLSHVSDQIEPTLSIPWMEPYEMALKWIKDQDLLTQYRDSDVPERRMMWEEFKKRDLEGMDMLLKIEAKECPPLIENTSGQAVAVQMKFLNHIIRICRMFGNEVDMGDPYQWPILSVEFTGLKHYRQDLSARFSLLDLPGYNDNAAEDTDRFIELMKRAAQQADVVVPVLDGPTIVNTQSWSEHIIHPEWKTKVTSVIITKLDLIENAVNASRLQLATVAKKCKIPGRVDCILLCATLKGMAAMQLQLRFDEIDRKYAKDPIPPAATAKTEPRLGKEIKGVIEQLTNNAGSLYCLHNRGLNPEDYEAFTMDDWRNLVEEILSSSQLRKTCDKFAEHSIEEARRLRLSRFIEEIEPVLDNLVSSLDDALTLDRASPSELDDTQRETERVLSKLQDIITKWAPKVEQVRIQQEDKLHKTLTNFEQVAREHAEEAISRELRSLTLEGETYVLGRVRDQEALLVRYRRAVQVRLNRDVEDVMRELMQLWDENHETIVKMSRDVLGIAEHPNVEAIITKTIDGLVTVRRLDPKKIRIAVSSIQEEEAGGATNKKTLVQRWGKRISKLLQHKWSESSTSVSEGLPLPSGSSGEHQDGAFPSSTLSSPLDPENHDKLGVAMRPASIAKYPRMGIPELQDSVPNEVNSDSKGRGGKDKGTMKLTREELYKLVLSTPFHPVISRVRANAKLCMTESLNEMAVLAHRVVVDALEECYDTTEKQITAQRSKDTKQLEAGTLERLTRWGNLVAALGAIDEMKRLKDEPVIRFMPSRPPSTLIHSPRSSFAGSPSTRSSSPSLNSRSLLSPI